MLFGSHQTDLDIQRAFPSTPQHIWPRAQALAPHLRQHFVARDGPQELEQGGGEHGAAEHVEPCEEEIILHFVAAGTALL